MASSSQLRANRANAKRSTGPNTAVGKQKSKYNALKHGLSAKQIVLSDEDPAEYEALLNGLIGDFAPTSSLEFELVEQVASRIWRIRRIPRLEAAILEFHRMEIFGKTLDPAYEERRRAELAKKAERFLTKISNPTPSVSESLPAKKPEPEPIWRQLCAVLVRDVKNGDMLGKLSRYEASLMNGLTRTLNMLFQVQSQRVEEIQAIEQFQSP